jgi:HTH-type transcriptional regulator, sugar sensing transcriptional regulator
MLSQLRDAGLSENEAKVYFAMLELGPSSVMDIAAKAGVNRPTAYAQIELLKKRGLAGTEKISGKTHFVAKSPEHLEFLINKQKSELDVRREELLAVMPELRAAFSLTGEKPVVRYFEGKEGSLRARQEVLKCKEKFIRSIARVDNTLAIFPSKLKTGPSERLRHKIRSRFIYTSDRGPIVESNKKLLRETKFIPLKKLPITFDFAVFDDKVKFEILKGKRGSIIIQNKDIAQSFKNLFDFIWDSIKE